MKCEELTALLPEYQKGRLADATRDAIEAHCRECQACNANAEIWRRMEAVADEKPSPRLRARFDEMLEAYEQGKAEQQQMALNRPGWMMRWAAWMHELRSPLAQAAVASALVAVGFIAGQKTSPSEPYKQELSSLHEELAGTRQMVALSMLQQQSASGRLEGVSWSMRMESPDPKVLDALLHTLRYDSSVDVRMAALDALRRYHEQPVVRKGVVDSLKYQQSPLVQIAVVDYLVEVKDGRAVAPLQELQKDPKLNPTVRQRVEWGIAQLKRG